MTAARTAVRRRRPSARDAQRLRPPGVDVAAASSPTHVDVGIQHLERIAIHAPPDDTAGFLLDAAAEQPAQALPYAETLERRFGQRLDWVHVRQGPLVTDVLDTLGARAATRGCDVFLREASAPLDVVAHEVTHALQARRVVAGPAGVVAEGAAPEVEATRALRAPVGPAEGLAPGAIALLRMGSPTDPEPSITVQPPAVLSPPATDTATAPSGPAPEAGVPTSAAQAPAVDSGTTTGAGEELVAAPVPELTVSPEAVAAREEAIAAAEAGLAGAASADELLRAFATAPPSVKARQAASLNDQLAAIVPAETEQWQAEVPTLDASLEGEDGAPPEPLRVEAPAGQVELEPEAAAPAPEPEIAEVPAAKPFTANDAVTGAFGRLNEPPPEQLADAIGDTLEAVQTTDPSVPRSPGPPPQIPLGGETDPALIVGQEETATSQAAQLGDDAGQAVVDGPGPEQVQPTSVHEPYAVEAVEPPAAPTLVVPEGPAEFLALELPPEVQLTFDEQQQTAMQESMAEATASADQATAARDSARDEAVATAQQGADELNEQAQSDQTAAVVDARTTIQTERQSTVDAQHAEVERVRGEASERRQADEGVIDDQVALEQQAIDDSYVGAETDIDNQVTAAEDKARAERERAEKEAEDESWWDRAVDFVKDAFDSLVSLIGDIFDAVRAAVNAALDAVKAFALSVIDRLATFVKDAIAAYGEFLKFAVDALIGDVFPELAEALNSAIDTAVETAQAAVDVVADGLKAGISALVEGLRAGINAALDAYEAAISFAVSVVGAALTGDWGLVARKILEAVLKLVGVDPEAFYAFVGRAQETFDIIVDDPLGFLSNIVDAVVGGVQGFADRFGEHLKKGVIEWLTGTLGGAGIVLPPALDLVGVLDLARQILGLTWERIRAKAVTLIGEQNVARLEYIGGYITTLVTEGWGALWEKLKADLGGLMDMVFDGIKTFLMERVVLAMIKKIPALFGPAGAIVQLVMTAWNLYTFLRDQLSRLGALVRSVVDTIGDIARGVLTQAVTKVEEVLGSLVPLALDLLARLLGLGNLGEDVRKVVDKVQEFIDKAIDGLIARVLALFSGQGTAGAAAPASAAPADVKATGAPAAAGEVVADPQVKQAALDASYQRISSDKLESVEALQEVVGVVYREFQPRGLAALWFEVTNEASLQGRLMASASDPVGRVVGWGEIFDPLDPSQLLFQIQPRNETHAALSVDGVMVGTVQASDKDHHAEENLLSAHWDEALDLVRAGIAAGKRPRLALAINRAPCNSRCAPLLSDLAAKLDPALKRDADFILAPTGVYEPTEKLTKEEVDKQRAELTEIAKIIGRPAAAVLREYLSKVRMTDDTTTFNDLRRLVAAGWDLRQLQARETQSGYGRELAIAAHTIAEQVKSQAKAGAK